MRAFSKPSSLEALTMPRSKAQGNEGSEEPSAPFQSYRQWAEKIAPQVQAALAGECVVAPQRPLTEAWLTFAFYWGSSEPLPLEGVISRADMVNHDIPSAEEVAWAFLRIKKRGWLSVQGDSYALTAEGRRVVQGIAGKGGLYEQMERLEEWTLTHPPPGDE